MAQKANNYIVMAKYNGADLGELHIRFSLILRSLLLPAPDSSHPPKKKVYYSEEHYMDVLSEIKVRSYLYFKKLV